MTCTRQFALWKAVAPALVSTLALAGAGGRLAAQGPNPTSAANPFFGSVTARPASDETLKLSLDDAIGLGLKNNLGLRETARGELTLQGEKNQVLQAFLPTITLNGDTGAHQQNLAALGFGPGTIKQFGSLFPPGQMPAGFSEITKDELTQGQIRFGELLFSGPVISAFRALGVAERAARSTTNSARGEVVQQVATAYLHAIAAESEVDNAKALVASAEVLLRHAHEAHAAGTVSNLDELRARVAFQAQQQVLIAAQNAVEKDLIQLKREIGIDPGQRIVLTDTGPYSELAVQTPEEVRAVAYKSRQDYQALLNQVAEFKVIHSVYRAQRLPTLSFGGMYAVSHVNGVGAHGNFAAISTLSFPLFREAKLRGDEDAAQANLDAVNAQLADLRVKIDQQVRSALLDVDAGTKLVEAARSNVELATRALADETDRVNAGVDDNLPLVTAQATLASAQSNLVESLFRYNVAKLALARAAGVLESQYREYLGR